MLYMTMTLNTKEGPGTVTQACHPSTRRLRQEDPESHASPSHIVRLPKKDWALTPMSMCPKRRVWVG